MATFAFSTTGSFWKTRYSFEPDCYASSDNFFVSFSPVQNDDDEVSLCWEHNKNKNRNNFYGQQYPSSISVVSNENASAEKSYKALSLETNENFFSARVFTNIDSNSPVSKPQEAVIPSFSEREECMYASIGSSVRNSTTQVKVIASAPYGLISDNFNKDYAFCVLNGWLPVDNSLIPYTQYKFSIVRVEPFDTSMANALGFNTKLAFIYGVNTYYIKESNGNYQQTPFVAADCFEDSALLLMGFLYNPSNAIPGNYLLIAHQNDIPFNFISTSISGRYIIAVTNPSINGDVIRGKYARIDIESQANGIPFELYAVNAEYAMSPLDSSR